MKPTLRIAGVYNLCWGGCMVLFPSAFFHYFSLPLPNYPILWQGLGMVVGVYGIAYWLAADKPFIQWPIILVGFIGKFLGLTGFLYYYFQGSIPIAFLSLSFFNDAVWLLPFALILWGAFEYEQTTRELLSYDLEEKKLRSLNHIRTVQGNDLQTLINEQPTLVIFLRHFGCTFCREALAQVSAQRSSIEEEGTRIVLVHMVDAELGKYHLAQYGLDDLEQISDPERKIYQAFGLCKGNIRQLFGIPVLLRGLKAGLVDGHSIGAFVGNGLQMPGVFLLYQNKILQSFTHHTAADRPDYVELAHKSCEF